MLQRHLWYFTTLETYRVLAFLAPLAFTAALAKVVDLGFDLQILVLRMRSLSWWFLFLRVTMKAFYHWYDIRSFLMSSKIWILMSEFEQKLLQSVKYFNFNNFSVKCEIVCDKIYEYAKPFQRHTQILCMDWHRFRSHCLSKYIHQYNI